MSTIEAPVRYRDATGVVDLPKLIDSTADDALSAAYSEATSHGSQRVLLNFASVEFLSSTGIALIVGLLARARKEGCQISAVGLSDHYREIFEITRLADFMTIFSTENAAFDTQKGGS